jgi:hypothetical protein
LDGYLGIEPRKVMFALADSLCDLGRRRVAAMLLLNYTLAFALQMRNCMEASFRAVEHCL